MRQTIQAAVHFAAAQLAKDVAEPRLEAEILLAHILQVSRVYLHTWPDTFLEEQQSACFQEFVVRRMQGEPIAYLTGRREFWSLDLVVTPDVLIPRPETELLVELTLEVVQKKAAVVADLGTGSGAIALAVAHERPHWEVHAVDASLAALKVATLNAKRLNLSHVQFHHGDWCAALPPIKFDAIVSNPPYIAEGDAHLAQGDLRFEPRSALVSAENGLKDIAQISMAAKNYLNSNGILVLEYGFQQAKAVTGILHKAGYTHIKTYTDLAGRERGVIATQVGF